MESDTVRSDAIIGHRGSGSGTINVKKYDFRRPDKFSKDQIRTVSIMHETFARLATASVCAMMRSMFHMRVSAVDQLTYAEFIRSIPNPTTMAIILMDPLKGSALMEIDPSLTFQFINRVFGSPGTSPKLQRDLTDIECSVMEGIVTRILANLREAWSTVLDLRPRLDQIETNPMFAQIVPPTEMVVLVTLEATMGNASGFFNLCFPYLTIEPIIPKLSAQYWYSSIRRKHDTNLEERAVKLKAGSKIVFETSRLSITEIAALKKGTLVRLPDPSTAILDVGGKPVLTLDARRSGNGCVFTVRDDIETLHPAEGIFHRANEKSPREAASDDTKLMAKSIAEEVGKGFKGITAKMEQMEQRQAELADMLAYGTRGSIVPESGTDDDKKPFSFIRSYDKDGLVSFLAQEHPQTIALIVSYLEPGFASSIISSLPVEMQPDIAERIATLDRCAPEVIRILERMLKAKFKLMSEEKFANAGGIESLVDILQVADRKLEKTVIEALEKTNPVLAEEAKKRMFVFEDTTLLDAKAISLLVSRASPADLVLALKATDEKTKLHFLSCMDQKTRGDFETEFARLGPVRLSRVEEAQQKIIHVIRRMEETGEIEIARIGEEIVE